MGSGQLDIHCLPLSCLSKVFIFFKGINLVFDREVEGLSRGKLIKESIHKVDRKQNELYVHYEVCANVLCCLPSNKHTHGPQNTSSASSKSNHTDYHIHHHGI